MPDLIAAIPPPQFQMLDALFVAAIMAASAILTLAPVSVRLRTWSGRLFGVLALGLIGLLTYDGLVLAEQRAPSQWQPLPGLAVFCLAAGSLGLLARAGILRCSMVSHSTRAAIWSILIWTMGVSGWTAYRWYDSVAPRYTDLPLVDEPEMAVAEIVGVTDQGREVPLYRFENLPVQDLPPNLAALSRPPKLRVIDRAARDPRSNCHGWVFTDGKFLLDPTGVRAILTDNGYQPSPSPQAGDVIIYHLASGEFVHTGLVSGVLVDGSVLVESKWALEGRFVHLPEDQPYSRKFTYYRSPRGGHKIHLRMRSRRST